MIALAYVPVLLPTMPTWSWPLVLAGLALTAALSTLPVKMTRLLTGSLVAGTIATTVFCCYFWLDCSDWMIYIVFWWECTVGG